MKTRKLTLSVGQKTGCVPCVLHTRLQFDAIDSIASRRPVPIPLVWNQVVSTPHAQHIASIAIHKDGDMMYAATGDVAQFRTQLLLRFEAVESWEI